MSPDDRKKRIEDAALKLLKGKGYAATSMLAIAKQAKTSNQTMYKLYENKQALFAALVQRNANIISQQIDDVLQVKTSTAVLMHSVGVVLLTTLLSEDAIVLNRAAVGDVSDTKKLGAALAQNGRDVIAPKVQSICAAYLLEQAGKATSDKKTQEFTAIYLDVLIGDLQIRCATGAIDPPSHAQIKARSKRAFDIVSKLV